MLVMEAIAEILKREGISHLFCYPTTPIIEAAAALGIRPILCRQERVGVDMANGYARTLNGRPPAAFAMQYGPGAENAFSGVATAFSDGSPVLVLPLGHPRDRAQVFPMFRASRAYDSVTKQAEELVLPGETANVMRRAFAALKTGRLGPVMVEVPQDVVGAEIPGDAPLLDYTPPRPARSAGDPDDIDAAARLLVAARCPVIYAGQGVMYAGATAALRALAELLAVPVMTTLEGKGAFPEDHALSLGTAAIVLTGPARHFLHESDVVLGIGCSLTRHNITAATLPPGKRVIHATNDARDLHKAYPTELPILGDAQLVLAQLIAAVRERLGGRPRDGRALAQRIAQLRDEWLARWQARLGSAERPITPYRVIAEFMRTVDPAGAIVTHDSGSPRDQIIPFYRAVGPRGYIGWGKSHALGTGLGLTIGAKLAAPEKFCVNFMGDAAFGMTGLDFETAVRVNAPICTVVFNNATMAIETGHMRLSHEKYRTRDIGGNYAALARDLGGWSERVEDPEQIAGAITRARRATGEGRAALLEFITGPEQAFSHRRGAS